MSITNLRTKLDQKYYPEYLDRWDDILLRGIVLKYLNPGFRMLDIGAGAGIIEYMNFKGLVSEVVGIDPDPRIMENKFLDRAYIGYGDKTDFCDSEFDIIICDNVLEHIENPKQLFSEVHRLLKPGGYFISKTPNKFYYVSIIATFTPHFIHEFINRKRGFRAEDTFPTLYKINTKRAQLKYGKLSNLEMIEFNSYEGRPEYLRYFGYLYYIGIAYERVINKLNLNFLKTIHISVFKKS